MLLDVTAAFLYGDCERPLFLELSQEDPGSSIKPELGCEADQILGRDARRSTAAGEACREDAEGLGLHRDEGSARRVLPQGERCGGHPPRGRLLSELKAALETVCKFKGKTSGLWVGRLADAPCVAGAVAATFSQLGMAAHIRSCTHPGVCCRFIVNSGRS